MEPLLEVKDIVKAYAGHVALKGVSLTVPKGSIFGLLGPNGAGKSSLIRIINQITMADEGEVLFDGERLQRKHIARIGYLPEERGLYRKMKVGEQLVYLARLKGMDKATIRAKLKDWFERFEMQGWWEKKIEDLSKGMQQKVQFIATVLHEPSLLILDEPFTGFDPINANRIKDEILALREQGATVIFSTHRMESVEELCDDIALLNRSLKVLDGKKADIKERFSTNTFQVDSDAPIEALEGPFEIVKESALHEGRYHTSVRILEGRPNDLLAELTRVATVQGFHEVIPSMNEIFIEAVGEDPAAIAERDAQAAKEQAAAKKKSSLFNFGGQS